MIAAQTYSIIMTASEQTQFNRNARSVLILCGFAALILIIVGAKLLFDNVIGPKLDELEAADRDDRKARKKRKSSKSSNNSNSKNNNNNQNDRNTKNSRNNGNYEEKGGVDQNTGSLHFASLDDTEDADYGEDD